MNLFNIIPFVFVISFINASQLKPLQRYTGMDDQTFHISLKDKYSIIAFQLTTFAGNTNIQDIFSDNEMTEQIQFTVYDSRRTANYLIQDNTNMNFSFNVTCSDHCYYHLIVLIPQAENYKLEKGYSNIISFPYGDDLLNYLIEKNTVGSSSLLVINCLNCIPFVSIKGLTYQTSHFIQYEIRDTSKDLLFHMKMKQMDSLNNNNDEICNVIVDVIDYTDSNYFTLLEGTLQHFTLTNSTNILTFKYLHLSSSATLSIMTEANEEFQLIVYSASLKGEILLNTTVYHKKEIKVDSLENKDLFVSVIKRSINSIEIPFSIILKSVVSYPTYFQRSIINYGYMSEKQSLIYYTDVKKKEKAKIYINYKEGGGKICARLVTKDEIDDNPNWNHRIDLSQLCTKNQIEVSEYSQIIELNTATTYKCDKGCELYITIQNLEESNEMNSPYLEEFSIYYMSISNKDSVTIPLNEDIIGDSLHLSDDIYYSLIVPVNTSRLLISFESNIFRMYLNVNKKEYPTELQHDMKMITNNLYELNAEAFNQESFKDNKLTFYLVNHLSIDGHGQYKFKIMPQYKNTPNIIYASGTRTEYCDITKIGEVCYFMVPKYFYENNQTLVLSANNEDEESGRVQIYANIYSSETIDKLEYTDDSIKNYLPSQKSCQFFGSNFVHIKNIDIPSKMNNYLIVQIIPSIVGKIGFNIGTVKNHNTVFNYYLTNPKLYYLQKSESLSIFSYIYKDQGLEVKLISGKGLLNDKSFNNIVFSEPGIIKLSFTINEDYFAFTIGQHQDKKAFLREIKDNEVNILSFCGNDYPFRVFVPISNIAINQKELTLNIKLRDILYESYHNDKDLLEVTGYLVSDDFMKVYIYNRNYLPLGEEIRSTNYDSEKTVIMKFTPTIENAVLLLKIDKDFANKNVYKHMNYTMMVIGEGNIPSYPLIQNKINLHIIEKEEMKKIISFKLSRTEYDKYFFIELDISNLFTFSVESYKENPVYKNETKIIKKANIQNGINVLLIESKDSITSVIVSIIPKGNSIETTFVKLWYRTSNSDKDLFAYNRNMSLKYSNISETIDGVVDNIIYENKEIKKAKYYLRIYNKEYVKSEAIIDNMNINYNDSQNVAPLYEEITTIDNTDKQLAFSINKVKLPNEIYITLFSAFTSEEGNEYKKGFNMEYVNFHINPPKKEEDNKNWIILVSIVIVVVILIIMGVFLYMKKRKNKWKKIISTLSQEEVVSNLHTTGSNTINP